MTKQGWRREAIASSSFLFFFFFSVGLSVSLSFYFCWTLLCMVWFLTFSFFVLYLFLKFPKLSKWLQYIDTSCQPLEILKAFNFLIKDELSITSFQLWPLSPNDVTYSTCIAILSRYCNKFIFRTMLILQHFKQFLS